LEIVILTVKPNGKLHRNRRRNMHWEAIRNVIKPNNRGPHNKVHIAAFYRHFELITYSQDWDIDIRNHFRDVEHDYVEKQDQYLTYNDFDNKYIDLNQIKETNKLIKIQINELLSSIKSQEEILNLVDNKFLRDDILKQIDNLKAEISLLKANKAKNKSILKNIEDKSKKLKIKSAKRNKDTIMQFISENYGTEVEFAIDTLLQARVEFTESIEIIKSSDLNDFEKTVQLDNLNSELSSVNKALEKLGIV
jgi:hypothetical protein